MKKGTVFIGLALAGSLALTGCAGGNGAPKAGDAAGDGPVKGGTVHVLQASEFSHLDPAQGFDAGVQNFYRLIYRTLTMQGAGEGAKGTEIVPDLAESLGTPNEDATVWTFTLKDDIFFEDGTPITSADIKFGVERSLDPAVAVGSPYPRIVLDVPDDYEGVYISGPLDSIETPDDKTIVFHLKESYADFNAVVAQSPFTPFPADGDVTTTSVDQQPIASGPYKVTEYEPGASLVLERNEKWDPKTDDVRTAAPDSFEWTFGLDAATIDERLIAGQGEDANAIPGSGGSIQPASVARVQGAQYQDRTLRGIQGCTTYLALNTTKPGMDNLLVRQAINTAIDKDAVKDAVGGSQLADVATVILPPQVVGREEFDLYGTPDQKGDPEKAKELLAEAGVENLTFTIDVANSGTKQATAEAIQASLAKAGITAELNPIESASFYEVISTPSQQHDAALTAWCPDWPTGATFLPPLFEGSQIFEKGNWNTAQLNDPAVNERIAEIRQIPDIDEANAAWGALDKQIMELAPVVPLVYPMNVFLYGENIAGAYSHAGLAGGIDFISVGLKSAE